MGEVILISSALTVVILSEIFVLFISDMLEHNEKVLMCIMLILTIFAMIMIFRLMMLGGVICLV
ncbi:hypothetical protein [Fusobacterium varium]|uniref:Uncharacterized protein n=1 Tax=Fusobacterium varium ATCC 27725 TaxID=469618 RepID=A0ABM6U897_FUSVA|nr:hypothetical protein [Fusobacterium varium]AVQ32660.1 hypothetical protein C4N18_15215 [Fusobacterium varium ATCC 27725]EES63541.2 hypothetical protein FVAG_02902 [Fusobacterium varium ATCC 27725]